MRAKVNRTRITADEICRVKGLAGAGHSTVEIAAHLDRSESVIRRLRLELDCAGRVGSEQIPPPPLSQRVVTLAATIERKRRERRSKAYIKELRKGLIVLRAREQGL